MVEVIGQEKVRALLYSHQANFNIGKIRQVLARDDRIQLDLGLDVIRTPGLAEKASKMSGYVKLPNDRNGFYEYDIIILGPCELENLTENQIDGLYSFVAERGGGLILLAGRDQAGPASWRSAKARALLPVLFDSEETMPLPLSPGKIEVTYEGIDSKIISPSDFKDYEQQTSPYYKITKVKPASTTLATIDQTPNLSSSHRPGQSLPAQCFQTLLVVSPGSSGWTAVQGNLRIGRPSEQNSGARGRRRIVRRAHGRRNEQGNLQLVCLRQVLRRRDRG